MPSLLPGEFIDRSANGQHRVTPGRVAADLAHTRPNAHDFKQDASLSNGP